MAKYWKGLVLAAALIVGTGAWIRHSKEPPPPPQLVSADVTFGDVVDRVSSTGTLMPERTVPIGSEVSGIVQHIYVDFNSLVTKGEVIARLDPSIFQAALDSAEAKADEVRLMKVQHEITLNSDERTAERAEQMFSHDLASEQDREVAEVQVKEDKAQLASDDAQIAGAEGAVQQARVDLQHCVITSPVDGVVVERDADEGQAIAARTSAPTLYILATDLRQFQLVGAIDETDMTRVRPGDAVTFTVEAYRGQVFHGTLKEVRLSAITTSDVVTYQAIASVPNGDLKLRPSMTAKVSIEVGHASGVTRVPMAALKFHPTRELFAALGQTMPPVDRLSEVSARLGSNVQAGTGEKSASATAGKTIDESLPTIADTIFAGQVWTFDGHTLNEVKVQTGRSDGTWAELKTGELKPGDHVVTGLAKTK